MMSEAAGPAGADPLADLRADLAGRGELKPAELADRLQPDRSLRGRAGRGVPAEAYLDVHHRVRGDPELIVDLILGEVLLRRERGERPDPAEYARRFPELADAPRQRARLRLDAGDAAGAVADARRAVTLFEGLPSRDGREWFWLACAQATLATAAGRGGAGPSAGLAPGLADRAMKNLRRAAAAGYRSPAVYRYEPALGPLRGRDDFRLLMMDLAMPAAPFAAAR